MERKNNLENSENDNLEVEVKDNVKPEKAYLLKSGRYAVVFSDGVRRYRKTKDDDELKRIKTIQLNKAREKSLNTRRNAMKALKEVEILKEENENLKEELKQTKQNLNKVLLLLSKENSNKNEDLNKNDTTIELRSGLLRNATEESSYNLNKNNGVVLNKEIDKLKQKYKFTKF